MSRVVLLSLLLALLTPAWAQDRVTIGSKTFAESRILAEIMAQMLEAHTDLSVVRRFGLSGTMVCFEAISTGELDIYPEYTGTGAVTILKLKEDFHDPLKTYITVRKDFRRRYQLDWLTPFGFNNTYVMAVRAEYAKQHNLESVSDLLAVEDTIRVGVSHEFLNRPDGLPGLEQAYGLDLAKAGGMEHGLAYQAIASGKLDLIDAYSTDGELVRYKLKSLKDDKQFFPPYHAVPVVRMDLLKQHPEVGTVLDKLGFVLNEESMQHLNYLVQEEKDPIPQVVAQFLAENELVKSETPVRVISEKDVSFLKYLYNRRKKTLSLTLRHLYLTMMSLGLAILVGVPTGIWITRHDRYAQTVLGGAGVIQTIPSIALLAFMIPIPGLGLGVRSAIVALFLYALLPIIRNTYTGIKEVAPGLLEAARGMGLTNRQLLTIVELPLATRTIMAGVRTSAVINVGVATLAAFIGAGGLGDPIVTGLQLNDTELILAGAIPAALLAIFVDQSLGLIERLLAPKGLESK
jgi:osmoprotectant transport system substrate-binding protein/osmoprotectant transport system permease protein